MIICKKKFKLCRLDVVSFIFNKYMKILFKKEIIFILVKIVDWLIDWFVFNVDLLIDIKILYFIRNKDIIFWWIILSFYWCYYIFYNKNGMSIKF